MIPPKLANALTTAIVKRISKTYPGAGIVGVYSFEGRSYSRKPELREAVLTFCLALENLDQVQNVRRNFDLL